MKKLTISLLILIMTTVLKTNQSTNIEWNAQHYNQNSSIQFQKGSALINSWPFVGTEDILDVGCGNGALTAEMAKKTTGAILGTDASATMIAFAQQNHGTPNLSFKTINATQLPFEQTFDLAFSFNCLHWIQDKQAVFDNVYNALKPGGKFVFLFSLKHPDGQYPMIALANAIRAEAYWQHEFPKNHAWPWHHETQETIEQMLVKSGFAINESKAFFNGAKLGSTEEIVQHLLALSWLEPLAQEKQEEFVRELVNRYLATKGQESDSHKYEAYQMYAVVEKPAC